MDLTEPAIRTFSRSQGHAKRSLLERYTHEFAFRRKIAATALRRVGEPDDPEPLVVPIRTDECQQCRWHDVCLPLIEGSANAAVGRLDDPEWRALASLGIETVESLAALDANAIAGEEKIADPNLAQLLAQYESETTHRARPRVRLAEAIRVARMVERGEPLERKTVGSIDDLPPAEVEIDMDIEWDLPGRVYLWGFLVDDGSEPKYTALASFDELQNDGESSLAADAWEWLVGKVETAKAAGRSVRIYHYSHPEVSRWRRIIERDEHPRLPSIQAFDRFAEEHFFDLNTATKRHLRGVDGLGLKNVATHGAGFHWRDDDPGGTQSQAWHRAAVADPDPGERKAARERLLEYNADDVAATRAVRVWMRNWDQ